MTPMEVGTVTNVQKKIRLAIVVLAVLLAISLIALAGVVAHGRVQSKGDPAVAPDNVITPEQTTGSAGQPPMAFLPLSGRSFLASGMTVESASAGDTTLSLHRYQPSDSTPFQVTNMFPGDTESRVYYLRVSHTGSVTVHFHAEVQPGGEKLGEVLKCRVTVREDDVSVTLYDGLMAQMPGQLDYSVTSSRSTTRELVYVITAYLETGVGNDYQEKQLEADFRWWVEAETEDSPITPVGPNVPDKPLLDSGGHYAYIIGYPDGLVHPELQITRAESVTIFFRMLLEESRQRYWSQVNPYYDVLAEDWFNNAISTMTNAGIVEGRPGNLFDPNANITRAEFAALAVRFFEGDDEKPDKDAFSDITGHWANYEINLAYAKEIIEGYPDGTFKPDQEITRAEAMTIVNRVLERHPHEEHLLEDMIRWPDNMDETMWYYADVQEATNSHEYHLAEAENVAVYEIWQALLPVRDWEALEKEWSEYNSAKNPGEVVTLNIPLLEGVSAVRSESVSAGLPTASLQALAELDSTLEVALAENVVRLDSAALAAIAVQAEADTLVLNVQEISGEQLNEAQQAALRRYDLQAIYSATLGDGTQNISDFRSGQITLRVPYTPADAGALTHSNVLYVAQDGSLEVVPAIYEDGCMVFTVTHFSEYVIVSDFTADATGRLTLPPLWLALTVLPCTAAAAVVVILIKRRKEARHER